MPRLLRVVNDGLPEQPCALARSISEQIDGTGPSGPKLEADLDRYLLKIEEAAGKDVRTSILLLDKERGRLLHGAAPSLPKAYCDAIHGIVIGPSVGSCATAAYIGHAIFVTDVATDPLWVDFRDLALSHQLRSCWSTPIRSEGGEIIGAIGVYHSTARAPTEDEILAVKKFSEHVALAISRWEPVNGV